MYDYKLLVTTLFYNVSVSHKVPCELYLFTNIIIRLFFFLLIHINHTSIHLMSIIKR